MLRRKSIFDKTYMNISFQDHKFCDLFSSVDNMRGRFFIGAGCVFLQQVSLGPICPKNFMDIPQLPSSTIFFSEIPGDNTTNCPAVS
jgi:hypothetical protein